MVFTLTQCYSHVEWDTTWNIHSGNENNIVVAHEVLYINIHYVVCCFVYTVTFVNPTLEVGSALYLF